MNNLSNVYTSVPLTNVSLKYTNDEAGFISEKVSPVVRVVKDSGKIYSYGAENLRIHNTIRAVGGKGQQVDISYSSADHYELEDHVLADFIPEEIAENAESPLNPRIDTTEALTEMLMISREKAIADTLQSTSLMTQNTTLAGTDQWNDYDNSNPFGDINTAIKAVRAGSGKMPNTLILAWNTALELMYHPQIKDMFPGAGSITADMLKDGLARKFMGLNNLVIGQVMYNNTNKATTLDIAEVWNKSAIVAYIEPRPTLKSRSLSFTYMNKAPRRVQLLPQGQGGLETVARKSDYIQISDKYDQVLVDDTCGYLIDACVA